MGLLLIIYEELIIENEWSKWLQRVPKTLKISRATHASNLIAHLA